MPASIVATFLLWSTLLTPGARPVLVQSVSIDRSTNLMIVAEPIATIRVWPFQDECPWTLSEADIEEEEESGESEGLLAEFAWRLLPANSQGRAATIRTALGFATSLIRSPILRC